MQPSQYSAALNNERSLAPFIPQTSHIAEDVIITRDGDLQMTFEVQGIPFETVEESSVGIPKQQLNTLIRSFGNQHISLWQHIVHVRTDAVLPTIDGDGFAAEFNNAYAENLRNQDAFTTRLFLTLVYRPASTGDKLIKRITTARHAEFLAEQSKALNKVHQFGTDVIKALAAYHPERLGIYSDNGTLFSSALTFLNFLVCGSWQRIQVPSGPINQLLGDAYLHIGTDSMEIHTPHRVRHAMGIEIKDYSERTQPKMLDRLLFLPFEFVITQSFSVIDKPTGLRLLKRQHRHLVNTQDVAESQIAELEQAMDELVSGAFVLGEYCFNMFVFGDSAAHVREQASGTISVIQDAGFIACLSTTANDAAWYAQMPCNWFYRPRIAHLTSRNFASLAGMHNVQSGRRTGNPWGECLTVLQTPSGQPYHLNLHATPNDGKDYTGDLMLANTRVIGKSGVGKSVLVNTVLVQAQRFNNDDAVFSSVTFDIDKAAKQSIEAIGGQYLEFVNGEPTGCNPFQMDGTEQNILMIEQLVHVLVKSDGLPILTSDDAAIAQGVRTVMRLPMASRRLSVLLQNLPQTDDRETSLIKRLAKWCADDGQGNKGALSWALDCESDQIDLTTSNNFGFDCTSLLENEQIRTPVLIYLLYRVQSMIDGRRLLINFDEGFRYLKTPAFAKFYGDFLPTVRKHNALILTSTQSPKTVLDSSVSTELVEQNATEIYLPNPNAKRHEYVDGFGLTEYEFELVQTLAENSHMFLVKQHGASVLAYLDLSGMDAQLAVLGNKTAPVQLHKGS